MSDINYCDLSLGLLIVLFLLFIYYTNKDNRNFVSYYVDDKYYKVLEDKPNKEEAAKILQNVDNNIIKLIQYINLKYTDKVLSKLPKEKQKLINQIINRLNKTYKSKNLTENYPQIPGKDVSFNINKGEEISLCLRNYDEPSNFHQMNDIMFVTIHEISHSCNDSYGHDESFWKIFRELLLDAIECEVFKNKDYFNNKVKFCSLNISYNPILDPSLEDSVYFKKDNEIV